MVKYYELSDYRIIENGNGDYRIAVYTNPTDEEKRFLLGKYQLDDHTFNSAFDPDELARIEFETDHVAIILKVPLNYNGEHTFEFQVTSIGVFLFENVLIVVMPEDLPIFDNKKFLHVGSLAETMLKIINYAVFHFLEHLRVIDLVSDELAEKISVAMENTYLLNLFRLEKSLVYYQNAINSNAVLMDKMKIYAQKIGFTVEDNELLDDIIIENNQCYKQAEVYSNILASMMDARVSIVNNNLNILMKKLTIITIAIMAPTFVVSAFSMNVTIPLQKHEHAFWFIMFVALTAMFGFLFLWRPKK
jgi:magnesium transporter